MENWGLITYRETALLIDPTQSSSAAKQWVALVVGHEIAHQWFGNLVTMVTASGGGFCKQPGTFLIINAKMIVGESFYLKRDN